MKKEALRKQVLIVDDDELFRQAMSDYLSDRYTIAVSETAESALMFLSRSEADAVLVDITLPNTDGVGLLKAIRNQWPEIPVIMLTAIDRIQTVVECIKLGATDYLAKPVIVEELVTSIERAIEANEIRKELKRRRDLQIVENREYRLLGQDPSLEKVRKQIQVIAPTDSPVLIIGETGTGKEIVAREIHGRSPRAAEPFVAVNCGAIPKDLFETEFFGHKKGAFTGAQTSEVGKFQLANRGSLLLDEIGELPLYTQSKFLRVLEEQEYYPVGSTQLVHADARVIACTNRELDKMVQDKSFREDLFFRLNVYSIEIPPLRNRPGDIHLLAEHFMNLFNRKFGKQFQQISQDAKQALLQHPWKGNVRELRNIMERVILSEDATTVEKEHLFSIPSFTSKNEEPSAIELPDSGLDLEQVEKDLILQALKKANGNKTKAARLLNLSPPTLYYRLEKYGIS
jgi:two-component system response regulator AtoC